MRAAKWWHRLTGGEPGNPAAAAAAEVPDAREYGATGTLLFGGFLRDTGEYNPDLTGTAAFQVYEKMRRSDAQVAATLLAMKLPIRAAEWTVQAPAEATPVEKEAADFIREVLFEEIDWDSALSNALLMLDFGCACHEDVYYIDQNRWRLERLAPRLPLTFFRWITEPGTEKLVAIEQNGPLAGGAWGTATIPMSKAALFTFEQEGANWAGRSVMRPMYRHWYVKDGLYRIDAIAKEKNGLGIPTLVMGQDAKAEDRRLANEWVRQICAHERAGGVWPNGWTFSLEAPKGTLVDAKDSIAHHNTMISMAGLAQFMMLGQAEKGGNRALGQTMSDFFHQSLQATANRIGRVMRLSTVARLTLWNFGADCRPPLVRCAAVVPVSFQDTVLALQRLAGAGFKAAEDPEVEKYLRAEMGLPEPSAEYQARQAAADKAAAAAAAAGPGAAGDGADGVGGGGDERRATGPQNAKSGNPDGGGAGDGGEKADLSEAGGPKLGREPGNCARMSEAGRRAERCLNLGEIVGQLDQGRNEVAAALRAARSRIQAEVVNALVNRPVREMHRVSIAPDGRLAAEVEAILRRVYDFGAEQVAAERTRQAGGAAPAGAAEIRAAAVDRKKKRDPLGVYADGVVGEFTNTLQARATNAALDWTRRPGEATKGEIIRQVEAELDGQSDKWVDGAASKGVNEAFADGRQDGYEQYADEIGECVYSALLDLMTCGNCAAADGESGKTPDDITPAPNPDCDGGDRCRCVHVYVFSDEVRGK